MSQEEMTIIFIFIVWQALFGGFACLKDHFLSTRPHKSIIIFIMKTTLFLVFLLVLGAGYVLRFLNLRHLKRYGGTVPPGFEGSIDSELLQKTSAYTLAQSRAGLVESLVANVLLVLFFFGGLLPLYDRWIVFVSGSFIGSGVLFFLGLFLIQTAVDIPFNLYQTFRIENRFGFNTMTAKLWLSDLLKSTAISSLLLAILASAAFALIHFSPNWWWFWVWGFFALATLFFMYISPYVIEPLFHKFQPVRKAGLEEKVRKLMGKAGLKVSRVLEVDASRRSRHSNAYFTGIGKVKRIILFDTLFEQLDDPEILAILAHEVGHWKKGHILKRLFWTELFSLFFFYVSSRLLEWGGLPPLLGIEEASFSGQLVILFFLGSLLAFPLTPLFSWLSRRDEWQADGFADKLCGAPEALASALIKLSRENLANLHPHPLYAWFHYSHPPVVERVRSLRSEQKGQKG
jgi:STE24 endopeptidase